MENSPLKKALDVAADLVSMSLENVGVNNKFSQNGFYPSVLSRHALMRFTKGNKKL